MTKKKSEKCKYFDGIFGKYDKTFYLCSRMRQVNPSLFLLLYGEKRRSTKSIKVLSRQKSEGMVGCQNALRRDVSVEYSNKLWQRLGVWASRPYLALKVISTRGILLDGAQGAGETPTPPVAAAGY